MDEERIQQLFAASNRGIIRRDKRYGECWSAVDGIMVIYTEDAVPDWLTPVLEHRDENGNTGAEFAPLRT